MRIAIQIAIGIVFSGLIAVLAYRRGSLSRSGMLGAVVVGTLIFGFGGWVWGLLLIAFFVLSSLLSHYREQEKARIAAEKFDKGNARDLWQALANGGMGALIAVGFGLSPHPLLLAAFVGALATVNADTWATELGVLSRQPPRLITTLRPVETGTSGGVSAAGTLATLAGALAMGLAALLFLVIDGLAGGAGLAALGAAGRWWTLLPAAAVGGLAGSLFDSLLGATVQAIYFCPACQKETEKRLHTCGETTRHTRGWRWFGNDLVNFIASGVGAVVALQLAAMLWALAA